MFLLTTSIGSHPFRSLDTLPLLVANRGARSNAPGMIEPTTGLPLPPDAIEKGPAPGSGNGILVYEVPRGRELAATELRTSVSSAGWKIDSDETSPRGSVRIVLSKGGTIVKVSVAGDSTRASLIVTLP
jgi:hypothetical protein